MFLFNSVDMSGIWTTLRTLGSQGFRDQQYEIAREHYIQTGYITLAERFGGSAEVQRAVHDVHEYEDDPSYVQESKEHWDDLNQRFKTLSAVLRRVGQGDPVQRAQNTLGAITERYGLSENKEKGISNITQRHSALEISGRYAELTKEHFDAIAKEKGDLVATYFITYEFRIDHNQMRCRVIEQLQREGLIDWDSLFPNGGNHATVRRNVEAFDRDFYSAWKRGLATEETNKEARKREYRSFLHDRERNWGEEYSKWLTQRGRETGKAVPVDRD